MSFLCSHVNIQECATIIYVKKFKIQFDYIIMKNKKSSRIDDKYDLAQYCWYLIGQKLNLDEHHQLKPDEALTVFFNRLYHLFSQKQELLTAIIQHNPLNIGLAQYFNTYFKQAMQGMFIECFDFKNHPVPLVILADHFSNTVLLMLEWCFFKKEPISLSEAHHYLHILLGKLEEY